MREIKFRGYSDGYDAWKYGFGVSVVELSESMQKELGVKEVVYLHTGEGKVSVVAESVGQYTGLKGVNGIEIFDGDIIKVWITKTIDFVAMVDCLNGAFGIGSIPSGYGYHRKFSPFHNNVGTRYEVIGNMYENKELLEGK